MTLRQSLDRLADSAHGVVVGVPPNEVRLTYPQLLHRIVSSANGFRDSGVRPGDRVVMRVGSSLDDLVAMLGTIYVGAVPVSIKPDVPGAVEESYVAGIARQQQARFAHGLRHSALTTLELVSSPGSPLPDVADSEAVAFIQYTSGSTGSPRPVPLTNRALMTDIRGIGSVARVDGDRAGMVAVPLHHDMGLVGMLSCLVNDLGLYLVDTPDFLRRPLRCLELAASIGVTETAMPDFLLRFLANRLRGRSSVLSSWDTIYCGAEPIRQQSVRAFLEAAGPLGLDPTALTFCYGLAEASLLVSAHRYVSDDRSFDPSGPACLGRPIDGVEIRVDDEGSVRLRGDVLFNGYDNAVDYRENWFDTGDVGYLRDGELYLSGRRTDRLVINGGNLFVSDIENLVLQCEDVSDCVALPHGASFAVLVVPARRGDLDAGAIAETVTSTFAVAPTSVLEVPRRSIIRTASGKPVRSKMAEQLQKGTLG